MSGEKPKIYRTIHQHVNDFIHWGTDGQDNLAQLRKATLNVCATLFFLSTSILFFVRLAQGAMLNAMVDLVAVLAILTAFIMAKSGKFGLSIALVALAPPLLWPALSPHQEEPGCSHRA